MSASNTALLDHLLRTFAERNPMGITSVERNRAENRALFDDLGAKMSGWAAAMLGENWAPALVDGYKFFTTNVNRHQLLYEGAGRYRHSSYQEVYEATYSQPDFMNSYHWGVYLTTFFWGHHLKLYQFFREQFLARLDAETRHILELGSGSGIWGFLAIDGAPNVSVSGIDISETSVALARGMAATIGLSGRATYQAADALTVALPQPADACISCFLAEHLENPQELFDSIARNTKAGGMVFVTLALTAAEVDHIYEYRRESEPILMAERAGLRLVAASSAAPEGFPLERKYLPRSMALVLQKRHGEIW